MRTLDPVKHEAKRRRILEAAAECFATRGFHDTRTADICAAAGISSGNLFHYFPSKQAIFTAIFEQDGRDNADRLQSALAAEDPLAALLEVVEAQAAQADYPHLGGLMLEIVANARRDVAFAELMERNDRALRDGLRQLLGRAAERGQIDPELPPDAAADWIMVLLDGGFVRAAADSGFRPVGPMLRRIILRFLGAEGGR
ncbi:TetR/AcrR family transcriptional regulator [Inquilinus limosus]|uniref:TetR/AcrR family transcriptional regulator n=1 Tax=Inquilinus limosus TaxID=171674 RepID=UPI003F148BA0